MTDLQFSLYVIGVIIVGYTVLGGLKAWLIETTNHLINFLVFGLIIGVWH